MHVVTSREHRWSARAWTSLALLWLAGNGLRLTILSTPPLITRLHADLDLSQTEIGILTGLPAVLFACAAVPGSLLIAHFGAVRTLICGLAICAIASAVRGAAPNVALLDVATVAMGFGVAIMHPSLPAIVRHWLPHRIGLGTAVYTNGLIAGEIFPVALTIPVVLPLVGDSWRLAFVVWAVPVALIAAIVAALAPQETPERPAGGSAPAWWPDWRDPLIWRLGFMLGSINSVYFATNAFLPDYLDRIGRPDLISSALTALNVGQLPASILLLAAAGRLEGRSWPYVISGAVMLLSVAGMVFGTGIGIVFSAGLFGFAAAALLVLMLLLPPLLSRPGDVHRLSAAMFTVSYSCAVVVPIVSGFAWDVTGLPGAAFLSIGLCTLVPIALAPTIRFAQPQGPRAGPRPQGP
jgi:CP family cyanate transporter-like MFS transporter